MNLPTTDKNITTDVSSFIQRRLTTIADDVRKESLDDLQTLGLPGTKHEEYKYTPLTREIEKNFTFQNAATEYYLKDIGEYLIPGLKANIIVFINGIYAADH